MTHRWVATCLISSLLILATACTSSGNADPQTSSSASTSSATAASTSPSVPVTQSNSPKPGEDPRAKAAQTAYLRFVKADYTAERSPTTRALARGLATYAIDPALGTEQGQLINFGVNGIEWRGTPPSSRTRVVTSNFQAKPYPTVNLVDCPTVSSTWRPYSAADGKPLKLVKPKVAPPWATTVTVVLYKSKWMLRTTKTDMTRTCQS